MNESEKAAFLDGFQEAMRQANQHDQKICKVIREVASKDSNLTVSQISEGVFVCSQQSETADYDKVTVKDLDDFYSDPVNQIIVLDWTMGYLRDKAASRKTEGQLLDALKAEQKDAHDCSKYPHICKVGIEESGPAK